MHEPLTPEYIETLRRMSGREKLKAAFRIYWGARKLKAARLRQEHPDWDEAQVQGGVREIFLHART